MSRPVVVLALALAVGACSREKSKPPAHDSPEGAKTRESPSQSEGSGESFNLTVDAPAPVAPGGEAVARLTVVPTAGYHINKKFPTVLTLEPKDGITLAKTELASSDAEKLDESQLVFAVRATPTAAGSYQVDGKIKFAVCRGEDDCEPKRRSVSFTVAAQ